MPIAKVASRYQAFTDPDLGFTTTPIDVAAATCLVVILDDYVGAAATTLTDSQSNSYASPLFTQTNLSHRLQMWVLSGPSVSASMTWTLAANGYAPTIGVIGFSGTATVSALEDSDSITANAVMSIQCATGVNPSEPGEVVVTGYGSPDNASVSAPFSPVDGNISNYLAMAFEIQTTATPRNPTWTIGFSTNASMGVVCIKAAAEGPALTIIGRSVLDYD